MVWGQARFVWWPSAPPRLHDQLHRPLHRRRAAGAPPRDRKPGLRNRLLGQPLPPRDAARGAARVGAVAASGAGGGGGGDGEFPAEGAGDIPAAGGGALRRGAAGALRADSTAEPVVNVVRIAVHCSSSRAVLRKRSSGSSRVRRRQHVHCPRVLTPPAEAACESGGSSRSRRGLRPSRTRRLAAEGHAA
eukprot:COSAG04_NODE_1821_length_5499_cov_33.155000_7_plen_190_part_00